MTKEELIIEIRLAFKDVKLEDGVGLWEGQGIDDYADHRTMLELRKKDERDNWDSIPYEDLAACQSSLSFFDAKGMLFHLPKFLIFDISAEQVYEEKGVYSPDVWFTLGYNLDEEYSKERFSLFNKIQIESVIHYLEYKLQEIFTEYEEYSANYGSSIDAVYWDHEYVEINRILNKWKEKLNQ